MLPGTNEKTLKPDQMKDPEISNYSKPTFKKSANSANNNIFFLSLSGIWCHSFLDMLLIYGYVTHLWILNSSVGQICQSIILIHYKSAEVLQMPTITVKTQFQVILCL